MKRGSSPLSTLMGRGESSAFELIACEGFLSSTPFPEEILTDSARTLLEEYTAWLSELPRRDANEIAFATLLLSEVPELNGIEES